MEPLPFRSIIDPAEMALSESSSEDPKDSSIPMVTTKCPIDYCSRTSIQLSFSSASSQTNSKQIARLLKSAHAAVFGDRYPKESERIQRYLLSNNLIAPYSNSDDTTLKLSSNIQLRTFDCHDKYTTELTYTDFSLSMQKMLEGLKLYASISGTALYTQPHNAILEELFRISQLQPKAASSYIDTQMNNHNKHVVRSIIDDICLYRVALLDCYEHITEAPFAVILGSNFEALFGCCETSKGGNFCMISGYPGVIESLEYTLKEQSKNEQKLVNNKSPFQPFIYTLYREGSLLYICGDVTLIIQFFLYSIPLNTGLHSTEKSLPRIYSIRLFEYSYKYTKIACTIDEDNNILSIDSYLPFFSVQRILKGLYNAMITISKDCQILIELNAPTQHSKNFNYFKTTLCTDETSSSSSSKISPRNKIPGTYNFIKQIQINSNGFISHY